MYHNFHVVSNSIYPFFMGLCLTGFFLSLVVFFKSGLIFFCFFNLFFLVFNLFLWMKDVCFESLSGYHNFVVDKGFKFGFFIFVMTEVMFFFSIFWVYFDKIFLGGFVWWPVVSGYLDFLGVPFFGTLVLLSSGLLSTWAHNRVLSGGSVFFLLGGVCLLGFLFLVIQFYEYFHIFFNISDGWSGSIFFFLTGFHGFHVFLGVILLFLSLCRFYFYYINSSSVFFFEGSVVYWHFVDVVWFFLYLFVYV